MWKDAIALFALLPFCVLGAGVILYGPTNQYILENQDLTFECKVNKPNVTNLLEVHNDGGFANFAVKKETKDGFTIASVTIRNIPLSQHKKKIECEYDMSEIHQFTINVFHESDVPVIAGAQEFKPLSTELGDKFALNCTETRLVKNPIFVWSVGSCQIKQEQTGTKTSTYIVDMVKWNDGGIYTCTVLNPDNPFVQILKDQKNYRVKVTLAKPDPEDLEKEITAVEGKNAELKCEIAGFPADIVWEKDGEKIAEHKGARNISDIRPGCEPGQVGDTYSVSADGKTLTILTVEYGDSGRYACNVSNGDISVNYSYILKVTDVSSTGRLQEPPLSFTLLLFFIITLFLNAV